MIAPVSGAGAGAAGRRGGNGRRVEPTRASAQAGGGDRGQHEPLPDSRALVASQSESRRQSSGGNRALRGYADAAFLTQLIATREGLPQTRARRRAEPEETIAAYAATARSTIQLPAGKILRHSA